MALPPKLPPRVPTPAQVAQQVAETAQTPPQQVEPSDADQADWRQTISTGSLLLDKAISGNKTRYGGMPGGFVMEIIGPPQAGKTTILGEMWGNAQRAGGECRFLDPEYRLDASYCEQFGVKVGQEDIDHPNTVDDVFEFLAGPIESKSYGSTVKNKRNKDKAWSPNPDTINFLGVDSLASLASRMEVEQGDKMGMRQPKDFSTGFRVAKKHIGHHNIIMACSNQLRTNTDTGRDTSPGGNAIGHYSTIRISLRIVKILTNKVKVKGREVEMSYGKLVKATVFKNSLDVSPRSVPLYLIDHYGVDDIRANLQWLKDNGGFDEQVEDPKTKKVTWKEAASYRVGGKKFMGLDLAVRAVEEQGLEQEIRDQVVELYDYIESQIQVPRKGKVR